jgi:two-component system, chemotaxis family, protein-glutamate methylesterase/glutaminase
MIKVLVVDDSSFFRGRIKQGLSADQEIEVIGEAVNGQDALAKVQALKPDVVTMDIEMPVMDGITAVKKIMAISPLPILMFSSLTKQGASATLEALNAGATDFLTKDFGERSADKNEAIARLCERVRAIGARKRPLSTPSLLQKRQQPVATPGNNKQSMAKDYKLAVIGASTGGPAALENILTKLPANCSIPIILVQHMPATFTQAFADRLDSLCKVKVQEAADGDELKAGTVYIAPGGRQTYVRENGKASYLDIGDAPPQFHYKPCVDITFNSVANKFRGKTLAIVMTGMGSDGCSGARQLKQKGATVWAQDEASSVVYGMPMAVIDAKLADNVLSMDEIGRKLASLH